MPVDKSVHTVASIMYDAVFIPGGHESVAQLMKQGDARHVAEAFKHGKAIGAVGAGLDLLRQTGILVSGAESNGEVTNAHGVITAQNTPDLKPFIQQFSTAIAQHCHWTRPNMKQVSAYVPT